MKRWKDKKMKNELIEIQEKLTTIKTSIVETSTKLKMVESDILKSDLVKNKKITEIPEILKEANVKVDEMETELTDGVTGIKEKYDL